MQQKVDTTVDEMMREQEKIGQGIWFLSYEIKIVDYFKFINFNDFKFMDLFLFRNSIFSLG